MLVTKQLTVAINFHVEKNSMEFNDRCQLTELWEWPNFHFWVNYPLYTFYTYFPFIHKTACDKTIITNPPCITAIQPWFTQRTLCQMFLFEMNKLSLMIKYTMSFF